MKARELLDTVRVAERLKDTTRHCYSSQGRQESVAEHSWMMTLIALLLAEEFKEIDMDKVIRMCIIHDLGECFTHDIPAFEKEDKHRIEEEAYLLNWLDGLPETEGQKMKDLFKEMKARQTIESKVYKAIDSLEALIQHNLSNLSTWSANEYEFSLHYGDDKVGFSEYFQELREEVREDTIEKIRQKK